MSWCADFEFRVTQAAGGFKTRLEHPRAHPTLLRPFERLCSSLAIGVQDAPTHPHPPNHIHTHTHTRTHVHTHTHTHAHACTHSRPHTHIHTQTQNTHAPKTHTHGTVALAS